jgi:hypothetical protein
LAETHSGSVFEGAQRFIAGWSSPVARQAHNLKVIGSNPIPATKLVKTPVISTDYWGFSLVLESTVDSDIASNKTAREQDFAHRAGAESILAVRPVVVLTAVVRYFDQVQACAMPVDRTL